MHTNSCGGVSSAFVPLAAFLRPIPPRVENEPVASAAVPPPSLPLEYEEALRAARCLKAALRDAVDGAVAELLPVIAREVLARELRLANADVAKIAAAAIERASNDPAVAVRAHPDDLDALDGFGLERIADATLRPGDVCVQLRSGSIDCRLEARLEAAIAVWTI